MQLRVTVVRVYPSCTRVGSFDMRGRAGVNRVSLSRRLRDGTYRLKIRPRGASADVADVTVVIANGRFRRTRAAGVCRSSQPAGGSPISESTVAPGGGESSGGGVEAVVKGGKKPIVATTGALAKKVRQIPDRIEAAADDPFSDPFVLIIIGLLTLTTAGLGTLLLAQVLKTIETSP